MKPQIELSINPHHKDFNSITTELNEIVDICVNNTNFKSILKQLLIFNPSYFIYGSGANHIWISLKENKQRILIVLE